jgi:hypothetical protein
MKEIGILLLAVALFGLAGCSSGSTDASPSPTLSPVVQALAWSEAIEHVGETVTAEGEVKGTYYDPDAKRAPTILDVGLDYPDPARLTIVIWYRDRAAFPTPPESTYAGKMIRVTGEVSENESDGRAEIEVSSPEAIEIVE